MRTFKVSDQMYEQLKSFIVNPFDDTPEVVLARLIAIANKARDHWSPFEPAENAPAAAPPATPPTTAPVAPPAAAPAVPPAEPPAKLRYREPEIPVEEESVIVL
jgi:hypothetical protein